MHFICSDCLLRLWIHCSRTDEEKDTLLFMNWQCEWVVAVASGWVGDGSVEWVAHWVVANCQRQQWLGNETARNANQGLNKQRKTLEMKWKPVGWPSGSSVNSPMASGRSLGAWLCANVIM